MLFLWVSWMLCLLSYSLEFSMKNIMIFKGFIVFFFFPWLMFKKDQDFVTGQPLVFLSVHLGGDATFLKYLAEERLMYIASASQTGFHPMYRCTTEIATFSTSFGLVLH